jgi:adenine-specific DNA-methyltransferase
MGSKYRLLSWLHEILREIDFDTVLDAFSGSGCVAYLLKAMGKQVTTNDFLKFPATIATALVENSHEFVLPGLVECLLAPMGRHPHFIEQTFKGIFYSPAELRFLDRVSWALRGVESRYLRALVISALIRSCLKRQPRGVFTVGGDLKHYDDGRRDLRLSLPDHFVEQIEICNRSVFSNRRANRSLNHDVYELGQDGFDLVYLDPPYVPRSDDNCYMKRYHFLEGLSCYWNGMSILENSKVKKIKKPYTPFSYRRESLRAFDDLFSRFRSSIIALSYSSNGFPDLKVLTDTMGRYKTRVTVFQKQHRYHFGTHKAVAATRALVHEYLILGE